jgi:hypothetical protein
MVADDERNKVTRKDADGEDEPAVQLVRHWVMPKDETEVPDNLSCADDVSFRNEYVRKFAERIIAKYPDAILADAIGGIMIAVLDMPIDTNVMAIAKEFNCVIYRKVAE